MERRQYSQRVVQNWLKREPRVQINCSERMKFTSALVRATTARRVDEDTRDLIMEKELSELAFCEMLG